MDDNDTATPSAMVDQLLTEIGSKGQRVHVPGFGTLMLRGRIWWIRYSVHGQRREESSKSLNERDALRLLKRRIQDSGKGQRINPAAAERVRMADLFDALDTDYQNNKRRSVRTLGFRLAPLREAFDDSRAIDVTADRIARYVRERLEAKKAPATVNRELAALRRAFRLAVEHERIASAPHIRPLAENNVREGFVTADQFEAVVAELAPYLTDLARFARITGWRRSEPTTLEWPEVDREGRRLRLRGQFSKNGEQRTIPLDYYTDKESRQWANSALWQIIERRWAARTPIGDGAQFVFHRNGQRIKDFRGAWSGACRRAKLPKLLFHDLRRSAVNNFDQAHVPPKVAMRFTGHKTLSVYYRYRITGDDDVRAALEQTAIARRTPKGTDGAS